MPSDNNRFRAKGQTMTELANCVRCNQLFRKTISSKCPLCAQKESLQFQRMFRLLQESESYGGLMIEELSATIGMPVKTIQEYYLEGKLGTAGMFLKFKCRECRVVMDELHRKGRYCVSCSEKISGKAGVEVKPRQRLDLENEKRKLTRRIGTGLSLSNAPIPLEEKKKSFHTRKKERRMGFIQHH